MPRPKRCRRICGFPEYWSFVPEDLPENGAAPETILMTLDEYETIRLIDHQGMNQEECAAAMGVSRATVAGIYDSARRKLAEALVNGRRLRITGGSYRMDSFPGLEELEGKDENSMRIAVTYDQGEIWQHFGRTEAFKLYDIENGEIKNTQVIGTGGTGHGALAGFLKAADVDLLICGGIGMGARIALEEAGVDLLPGASGNADEAVLAFIGGTLEYNPDEVCHHHDHEEGENACHEEGGHGCHGEGGCHDGGEGHGEGGCCGHGGSC